MSYQLVFWDTGLDLDAREVYDQIMETGIDPPGLLPLDTSAVEAALVGLFPEFIVESSVADGGTQTMLAHPEGTGALDIGYTAGSVCCTTYGLAEDSWNAIITAMSRFGLPLYDPQIDERFAL